MKTNKNKLRVGIGILLYENTHKIVRREAAKNKFDALVSDGAAGREVDELKYLEIEELKKSQSARAEDRVPEKTARLLGIPLKSSYANALGYCSAAFIKELIPG
jgi:hypothetical protein